ncbi:hypothetical protein F5148DRAFT_989937 [Russula earlei]|uniref:Uncharacterized protein n=1 Tax=Russula earlei TaxID=71964 RepID=A0ACC0TTH2_9AGAM|nr:hypothetical protein F5148DRAFT_989937 [Russula earlei]
MATHTSTGIVFPSVDLQTKVLALMSLQGQYSSTQESYKNELLELDKKYLAYYHSPIFNRRKEIITGSSQPTAHEVEAGVTESRNGDPTGVPLPPTSNKDEPPQVGIPEFWLTALKHTTEIKPTIEKKDEAALKHLTDITFSYLPNPGRGFQLTFSFSKNDFFTNEHLYKTYYYSGYSNYINRAVGCKINWKGRNDLTRTILTEPRNNGRVISKICAAESFFNFFDPSRPPSEEAVNSGIMTPEEFVAIEDRIELDHRIGIDLKDKIIPRAIEYYMGTNMMYPLGEPDSEDKSGDERKRFK